MNRDLPQIFGLAIQHHQAGRLGDAETLYRQILATHPNHADTLHLLGLLNYQAGRAAAAIDLIERAIAINSKSDAYFSNLGLALAACGKTDQAIAAYQQAIALRPDSAVTHVNLAIVLHERGDLEAAKGACHKAVSLRPDHVDGHFLLGRILKDQGLFDESIASYQRAIALRPNHATAHYNLANAFSAANRPEEAVAAYQRAVAQEPQNVAAICNLGAALTELDQYDNAIAICRTALSLKPDYVEALCNLGNALQLSDKLDEAIECYRRAVEVQPSFADAHANLGSALQQAARFKEAIESFRNAIALKPDHHAAHWNLGLVLLIQGDFESGWPEFAWGWPPSMRRASKIISGPKWDGSSLSGQRILIHNQWGMGDAIQMARYLPQIAERGGKTIVWCQRELHPVLRDIAPAAQWLGLQDPIPDYDMQCEMINLPAVLHTTLTNIPADKSYLHANPDAIVQWKTRIPNTSRLKVGFSWLNKPHPPGRCPPVSAWAPLAEIGNVWWCSLQKSVADIRSRGPRGRSVVELPLDRPTGLPMTDWTSDLRDFADTAALIENLDLVITVDTAVAHLSAAMGKPTWLLLKYVPDWRWLMDRTDSPWYPTMRLFRQPSAGDWKTPVGQIVEAIEKLKQ
jgi:tetratricopeptide (TPR) repeat protein